MQNMLKDGDKAKRRCVYGCTQRKRCGSSRLDQGGETSAVEINRMNPIVHGCYDVTDKNGIVTTCPRENLEKIEEKKPYWGQSQSEPEKPAAKPLPVPEAKKCDPATAGVKDFGYGPACSFPKCHAMKNEDHSVKCPKDGQFNPEVIL